MTAGTVTANFTLTQGGTNVPGTAVYTAQGSYATFTPTSPLAINTQYVATIGVGARDSHGNALAAPFSWTFRTTDRRWRNGLPMNGSPILNSGFYPQVGTDGSNNAVVVWGSRQCTGCADEIRARRITFGVNGGVLGAETVVANTNLSAPQPTLAVSSNGTAIATWVQFRPSPANRYGIAASRLSGSPTPTWSTPVLIDNNLGDPPNSVTQDFQRAAIRSTGDGMVVWAQKTGGLFQVHMNRLVSGAFTGVTILTATGARQGTEPRVAFDSAGNALLVYREFDASGSQVMARRWNGTSFLAAEAVSAYAASVSKLSFSMNANGVAAIGWLQNDSAEQLSGIWTNRKPGTVLAGAFGSPRPLDSAPTPDGGTPVYLDLPQMAVAPSGDAFCFWSHGTELWTARYVSGGGWQPNIRVVTYGYNPSIAVDANGVAFLGWNEGPVPAAARFFPASGVDAEQQIFLGTSINTLGTSFPILTTYPNGNAIIVYGTFHSVTQFYYDIDYAEFN